MNIYIENKKHYDQVYNFYKLKNYTINYKDINKFKNWEDVNHGYNAVFHIHKHFKNIEFCSNKNIYKNIRIENSRCQSCDLKCQVVMNFNKFLREKKLQKILSQGN